LWKGAGNKINAMKAFKVSEIPLPIPKLPPMPSTAKSEVIEKPDENTLDTLDE
jgi:hypothetical protein